MRPAQGTRTISTFLGSLNFKVPAISAAGYPDSSQQKAIILGSKPSIFFHLSRDRDCRCKPERRGNSALRLLRRPALTELLAMTYRIRANRSMLCLITLTLILVSEICPRCFLSGTGGFSLPSGRLKSPLPTRISERFIPFQVIQNTNVLISFVLDIRILIIGACLSFGAWYLEFFLLSFR